MRTPGVGMLRKTADLTGLSAWIQPPGDVFADLAAAVADGADCVDGGAQLWSNHKEVCSRRAALITAPFGSLRKKSCRQRAYEQRASANRAEAMALPAAAIVLSADDAADLSDRAFHPSLYLL